MKHEMGVNLPVCSRRRKVPAEMITTEHPTLTSVPEYGAPHEGGVMRRNILVGVTIATLLVVIGVLVFLVVSDGGSSGKADTQPTSSAPVAVPVDATQPALSAEEETYLAAMGGRVDLSDFVLLYLGNEACGYFDSGSSFSETREGMSSENPSLSDRDLTNIMTSAQLNIC